MQKKDHTNGAYISTSLLEPLTPAKAPFPFEHFGTSLEMGRNLSKKWMGGIAPRNLPLVSEARRKLADSLSCILEAYV